VQAIGALVGDFDGPPFILLSGDDRTGGSVQGERLRVNGAHWRNIKRILIFANVYDGVPDWQHADPLLLVTAPEQPSVQVRVGAGRNDCRVCAIALLENGSDTLTVTRKVEYFADQRHLDERFGWGLKWQPGTKG
jgi:tellurite resistance protein TerA